MVYLNLVLYFYSLLVFYNTLIFIQRKNDFGLVALFGFELDKVGPILRISAAQFSLTESLPHQPQSLNPPTRPV